MSVALWKRATLRIKQLKKVSRELLEDSIDIEIALPNINMSAMATEIDRICLEEIVGASKSALHKLLFRYG